MSLFENFYTLLSKINEADLNRKDSDAKDEFFKKDELFKYIDGLMDKHNNDIEKVLDELTSKIKRQKAANDGCSIKEEENKKTKSKNYKTVNKDYSYGGMEASRIHANDLRVWEALVKAHINPNIVTRGLKLYDSEAQQGLRLSRHGRFIKDKPVFSGEYFTTVKDDETGKIHNVYGKPEQITLEKLKTLVYDPINNENITKEVGFIGDEVDIESMWNIKNKIQSHNAAVNKWVKDNDLSLGTYSPEIKYLCYMLSQKEGYPLKVLEKFLDSDRATPENIEAITDYYRINLGNNPIKDESVITEANNKYSEPVYQVAGRGEEGVIANEALKQLGFSFGIATTLSLPYDLIPNKTVKPLNPFQKPKEVQHKNVRIVAVPKDVVEQLLILKNTDNGLSFDIPEEPTKINEDKNVLYVQGDDDLTPFPIAISKIREILDNGGDRFKAGTLTPEEQEELMSHRNFTQKGIGGKELIIDEDQIIHMLNAAYSEFPYSIIFDNVKDIMSVYEQAKDSDDKAAQLIKRILNTYVFPRLAKKYPDAYSEKYAQNVIKVRRGPHGLSYRVIVPLSSEGTMTQKVSKFNDFDKED